MKLIFLFLFSLNTFAQFNLVRSENLKTPNMIAGYSSRVLKSPAFNLSITEAEFPIGSASYNEIDKARLVFNTLAQSNVVMGFKYRDPLTKGELFFKDVQKRDWAHVSYLDNSEPGPFPCHDDNEIACSDDPDQGIDGWALNACSFKNNGGYQKCLFYDLACHASKKRFFTVSINSHCYKHSNDPSSLNFPKIGGYLHEVGHGLGMIHTPNWPSKKMRLHQSIMQGKIGYLTAFDAKFLYQQYGQAHKNFYELTIGNYLRIYDDQTLSYKTREAKYFLPAKLYWGDGSYKSCGNDIEPFYHFQFFNKSFKKTEFQTRLSFANYVTTENVKLKKFSQQTMSFELILKEKLEATTYELLFEIDSLQKYNENNEQDNQFKYNIKLVDSVKEC